MLAAPFLMRAIQIFYCSRWIFGWIFALAYCIMYKGFLFLREWDFLMNDKERNGP